MSDCGRDALDCWDVDVEGKSMTACEGGPFASVKPAAQSAVRPVERARKHRAHYVNFAEKKCAITISSVLGQADRGVDARRGEAGGGYTAPQKCGQFVCYLLSSA